MSMMNAGERNNLFNNGSLVTYVKGHKTNKSYGGDYKTSKMGLKSKKHHKRTGSSLSKQKPVTAIQMRNVTYKTKKNKGFKLTMNG